MLNYLKKFALEILPSIAATVIGAYIVNHYVSRPAAGDAPVAAAVAPAAKKGTKPANGTAEVVNVPEHGVKAKGISERAMIEKAASEKPAEVKPVEAAAEAKSADAKSAETKPAETKPTETASVPAEPRRHAPTLAPKAVAKTSTPAPAASPAAPVEAAASEEHRDANDLARAAIERLRGSDSHTQEASHAPAAPRLQEAPQTVMPPAPQATVALRPLPPPISVNPTPVESPAPSGPYTASIDPNRPTPPADIPPPPPIDLRADTNKFAARTTNMAQDMLRTAKSMFHAVLPNTDGQSSSASQFTE